MCEQLLRRHEEGKEILDQGAHNYIAWSLNPPYCYVDLHDRVFQTVGLTAAERIEIRGGLVLVDQAVAPVIHQWDRHPALAQHVASHPRFRIL